MRFPTLWYVRPAKAQTSLRICAVWSEPLLVAWIFYDSKATDRTSFEVSKLNRRLHRLVWVYTCQNATLLEVTCHGSNTLSGHDWKTVDWDIKRQHKILSPFYIWCIYSSAHQTRFFFKEANNMNPDQTAPLTAPKGAIWYGVHKNTIWCIYSSTLQTRFFHGSKQYEAWSDCSPDLTAPKGAIWYGVHNVCNNYRLSKNTIWYIYSSTLQTRFLSRKQTIWTMIKLLPWPLPKEQLIWGP